MKKLCAFFAILFFSIHIQAQASNSTEASEVKPTEANNAQTVDKTGGKVNLPPEKTRPVRIEKFIAPPVIDGRLDDEAWISAELRRPR